MASYPVAIASLIVVSLLDLSNAAAFLQLRREEVKHLLLAELSEVKSTHRLAGIEEEMRPMYSALPKSHSGRLEPATVRYALHRYFVQKHGWYVTGLDNRGEAWNSAPTANIMKDRAPAYIQSLFADQLHGQGLSLHDLAVFAATLEDLVHAEATTSMEWIYAALGLPVDRPVTPAQADLAVHYMLVVYLSFEEEHAVTDARELQLMEEQLRDELPELEATVIWLQDLRQTFDLKRASLRNPFIEAPANLDESVAMTLEFGHHFGAFQNLECHALKSKLVDLEHQGTGRVLMSSFYSKALAGDWQFMESLEYLRNLGTLDETDPSRPSVVIPNYLTSKTNCIAGSGFYSICCMDECEGLMGHVERSVAAPTATSTRIAEVVSSLHSDTVDAPRNLSTVLLSRLDAIAQLHGGAVPLHGRLFAQWMHHAYPRECPYPHLSGTTKPMTQEEFVEQNGIERLEVSQEVMREHAARDASNSEEPVLLPWTFEEELVSEHKVATLTPALRYFAALAALVSFAGSLARSLWASGLSSSSQDKVTNHFV